MQEKEDVLNRSEFIDKIINLVDLIVENNKGCSFAINGRWGSGKSFVLERIKEKLIREQSEDLMGDKYFVMFLVMLVNFCFVSFESKFFCCCILSDIEEIIEIIGSS